ncbi:MAG: hypothetical protein ACOC2H_03405 [Spirochaetota bacterium]
MAPKSCKETFYNLLEFSITMDENPEISGDGDEMFHHLLTDFFFRDEAQDKSIQTLLKNLETPAPFKTISSIRELTPEQIREMVSAETINDTFAARIILNKRYLKAFYPNHQPEYKKMPTDVQMEIIDCIKEKNQNIINAFEKMHRDMEADRNRTILTLVALALKNVHLRTGFPLKKTKTTVEELIRSEFSDADKIFNADPKVMTDLNDDKSVRKLVKELFKIKKHADIVEVSHMIKSEFKRFERRLLKTM